MYRNVNIFMKVLCLYCLYDSFVSVNYSVLTEIQWIFLLTIQFMLFFVLMFDFETLK